MSLFCVLGWHRWQMAMLMKPKNDVGENGDSFALELRRVCTRCGRQEVATGPAPD
jgi:hypothetical protein